MIFRESLARPGQLSACYCCLADGAGGGTRTPDLDFTKVLLYQLSYAGTAPVRCVCSRLTRRDRARKIRPGRRLGKPQDRPKLALPAKGLPALWGRAAKLGFGTGFRG